MNYYLNAFNDMLRKRQENQMGGGNERAPTAFDSMTNTQRAGYYSDNPTMAAATQFGQKAAGFAPHGIGLAIKAQSAMFPQFVADQNSVARGIDPGTGLQVGGYGSQPGTSGITPTGLYGDQFQGMPAPKSSGFMDTVGRMFGGSSLSLNPAPVESQTPSLTPTGIEAANMAGGYGNFGGYGAGFGGPDTSNSFGENQYAQGGMVNAQHLMGRAPAPDDGYGALQGGEYVITKAAVEKYGKRMMDAINNGTFR